MDLGLRDATAVVTGGSSGMGRYHGRWSFETFTHAKGVFRKSTRFDPPLRYPPYTESQRRWMRWLA